MVFSNRAPTIAPGTADSTSSHASRSSVVSMLRRTRARSPAGISWDRSRQKYTTAAMNVPACRATSKVLLRSLKLSSSCQLNSQGTRIRWPLDEIGKNSDRPWVMPSTMACRIGM